MLLGTRDGDGTRDSWVRLLGRRVSRRAGLRATVIGVAGVLAAVVAACDGGDDDEEDDDD